MQCIVRAFVHEVHYTVQYVMHMAMVAVGKAQQTGFVSLCYSTINMHSKILGQHINVPSLNPRRVGHSLTRQLLVFNDVFMQARRAALAKRPIG
jgi:hypothetical protein